MLIEKVSDSEVKKISKALKRADKITQIRRKKDSTDWIFVEYIFNGKRLRTRINAPKNDAQNDWEREERIPCCECGLLVALRSFQVGQLKKKVGEGCCQRCTSGQSAHQNKPIEVLRVSIKCNLCGHEFQSNNRFRRFCETCKLNSAAYRDGEYMEAHNVAL